jgi:hypothetical protein
VEALQSEGSEPVAYKPVVGKTQHKVHIYILYFKLMLDKGIKYLHTNSRKVHISETAH